MAVAKLRRHVDRREALLRLGLDASASADDVNHAWRQAMKAVHPDTGSAPDPAAAVMLNEARAIALHAVATGEATALVPIEKVLDLLRARDEPRPPTAQLAAERAFKSIVLHHVGGLAYRKRQRIIIAAAGAGVTSILGAITAFARFSPDSTSRMLYGVFTAMAAAVTAFLGVLAWRAASLERLLNLELEEAGETLADRAAYLDVLDEIALDEFWTRRDLHEALMAWDVPDVGYDRESFLSPLIGPVHRVVPLARTAHTIGHVDFGRLLTTKGLEVGLVVEDTTQGRDGRELHGFRRA